MSLEQRITTDLKAAMRAKDKGKMRGIRAIKSAILLAKTDGTGTEIDEAREIQILQRLVKQRRDSLSIYETQNREDLAQKEREEIAVIATYLPEQLSDEELEARLKTIIAETGATSMRDMGKVMGLANQQLGGKAEGKAIAAKVKSLLS